MEINKESKHKIKDDRWHILNRPGMYVGSITNSNYNEYIIIDNKMEIVSLNYSPALVKIINEVIDNSCDILQLSKNGKISVQIKKGYIQVADNGKGIPVEFIEDLDGSHILTPRAMLGKAKAGSNFGSDALTKVTKGTNGVGAYCTNVLSKKFICSTCDGKKLYSGTWWDNALEYKEDDIIPHKKSGTTIYFEPDLKRFELTEISEDTILVIKQRILNLSVIHQNIDFTFNGEKIKMNRNTFLNTLGENGNIYEEEKFAIAVFPNDSEDFNSFSIVNGLNLKGGSHINYILRYIQDSVLESIPKKYKGIKPGDVKNKIKIFFLGNDFPELEWEGQTKEIIKNPDKQIKEYLDEKWKKILNDINKNKEIIDPIIFLYEAKLDAEDAKLVKKNDLQNKKKEVEKYRPAFKKKHGLILAEGDSAIDSVIANVGRDNYGFLPATGVPINALECKTSEIQNSDKFRDLSIILGIEFSKEPKEKLEYDTIILTMDADHDGTHIIGLYLAFFYKFCPYYFFNQKIFIFKTPVAILKDKKDNMVEVFLDQESFNNYLKKPNYKLKTEMKKGLGSLSKKEWNEFFNLIPLEKAIDPIIVPEDPLILKELIFGWLGEDEKNIQYRKNKIIEFRKKDI